MHESGLGQRSKGLVGTLDHYVGTGVKAGYGQFARKRQMPAMRLIDNEDRSMLVANACYCLKVLAHSIVGWISD
jgi:hypothetical protein